ncbi:DUF5620 domain-containing protein [Globicatella sulfidifaciens]|nr:DUF5620 domain-containing protein [Globicatella sulfidifaciens]
MDKLILYVEDGKLTTKTNNLAIGVELDHQAEGGNTTLIPVMQLLDGDISSVITLLEFHLSSTTGNLGTVVCGLGFSVNDEELEYWYQPEDLPATSIPDTSGKVIYEVPLELSNMLSREEEINVIMFGLWWSDQPTATLDSVTVHMETLEGDVVFKPINHNKLYYNGHYHDQLYLGNKLCWSVREEIVDPVEPSDDFSVSIEPTANWESGGRYHYQLSLTITNNLETGVTAWEVTWQAMLGVEVVGEWNSISETFPLTGKVITRNTANNGNLGAGQSIDISMQIAGDHAMVF